MYGTIKILVCMNKQVQANILLVKKKKVTVYLQPTPGGGGRIILTGYVKISQRLGSRAWQAAKFMLVCMKNTRNVHKWHNNGIMNYSL